MKGIMIIPYTEMSELAKRIRGKLKVFEELSDISMRIVEKTGERIMDSLHKSNPWDNVKCGRDETKKEVIERTSTSKLTYKTCTTICNMHHFVCIICYKSCLI